MITPGSPKTDLAVLATADNQTNGDQKAQVVGTVASGATDSGNPVKVGGKYNASAPTLDDGDRGDLQQDVNGNVLNREAYAPQFEDNATGRALVEQRCNYTNGTASAAIKSGAGRFFGVIVNSHTNGTLKFWDNTAGSGTVLCNTITFAAGSGFYTFPVAIQFSTGLYATVGGTIDYTILWI